MIASACYNLAIIRQNDGDSDEAKRYYRKAIDFKPDHVNANYNMACVLQYDDDTPAAIKYYRDTLRIEADHKEAREALECALRPSLNRGFVARASLSLDHWTG